MNAKAPGALSLGEYEAKRLRRMEENRRMLLSLNLPTIPRRAKPAPVPKQSTEGGTREEVRTSPTGINSSATEETATGYYEALAATAGKRTKTSVAACEAATEASIAAGETATEAKNLLSSSLELELDTFHSRCLGIQSLPAGKQTVVEALCPPEYTTQFSTMNNVHVWKNAITLLVSEECDVPYSRMLQCESTRVFFDWGARTQRQEISSEMVQQLRHVQRGNEELRLNDSYYASEESSATPVLLVLQHAKGPYIYCGQIGYLGYRYESDSVKFRWQLMDAAAMDWVGLFSVLCS
ncbi:hypothetical protein PC119_g23034 [Phytophthora cactorum]|nr:hypothetical protein PC119_g23034 [Phytophthora cactorum]